MKKFFSTDYSETGFNVATLLIRLTFGILICLDHGFPKLTHFSDQIAKMIDPFHIGHKWSLILVIFAETFCALMVVLGLFTRFGAVVLVFSLSVAAFVFHKGQGIQPREEALTYLTAFFSILLLGPGRYSVDSMMGK